MKLGLQGKVVLVVRVRQGLGQAIAAEVAVEDVYAVHTLTQADGGATRCL